MLTVVLTIAAKQHRQCMDRIVINGQRIKSPSDGQYSSGSMNPLMIDTTIHRASGNIMSVSKIYYAQLLRNEAASVSSDM